MYGIGLAQTFDEFGMWLHLNGDYWQRASFDAVIVLAAALGLAGFAPPPARWRPKQFAIALLLVLLLAGAFRLPPPVHPPLGRCGQGGPEPLLGPGAGGGVSLDALTPEKGGG